MVQMVEYRINPLPAPSVLMRLWHDAWSETVTHDFGRLLRYSLVHVGAFDADELVGFANVAHDGGVHAFLSEVCVATTHRHQGVGLRLVQLAVAETRKTSARWLHVDYEAALAPFYARAGFVPTTAGLVDPGKRPVSCPEPSLPKARRACR